jgi:hypothetical protein
MRLGALSLLVVLLLAACGSGAETEWPGPPKADAGDGSIPVASFNQYLGDYEDYAESPEALAAAFLRLDEHRGATTSLVTSDGAEGSGDRATAVATLAGVPDDSVESVRYDLVVTKEGDGWRLESAVRTQRCREGRGHAAFSPRPCV